MRYKNYYRHTVYIIQCADSTYYTGHTNDMDRRWEEHVSGKDPDCYTYKRRPLQLMWGERFQYAKDAIAWEKRIKKWSRAKKEALIKDQFDLLPQLSKCRNGSYMSKMKSQVMNANLEE